MRTPRKHGCCRFSKSFCSVLLSLGPASAAAEIVFDGTLGPEGAQAGEMVVLEEFGTRRGENLFHSFATLNVNPGETLTFRSNFDGPTANLISRVTGGSSSLIDGLLSSEIAGADFWLINPAGVVFGVDAALDVPGAVNVSTADDIVFEDGTRFSASNPSGSGLTVANPSGFGFLADNPAGMSLDGARLEVDDALTLVAGEIILREAGITAIDSDVSLVSVAGAGDIRQGESTVAAYGRLDVAGSDLGVGSGRMFIRGGELVIAQSTVSSSVTDGTGGGGIEILGDSLTLSGSQITSDTFGTAASGPISVDVGGTFSIVESFMRAQSAETASGRIGGISIDATDVSLELGYVGMFARGQSQSGDLRVNALNSIRLNGGFGTTFANNSIGAQNAGDVIISAEQLLIEGGSIQAQALGSGRGGTVSVSADSVEARAGGFVFAGVQGTGSGGQIDITANDVTVAGVSEDGRYSGISASTSFGSFGDAGNVTINTGTLEVLDGGFVQSVTRFVGNGGFVEVNASDSVLVSGVPNQIPGEPLRFGGIFATSFGTGNAGDVRITTPSLRVTAAGQIQSTTSLLFEGFIGGRGGTVDLNVGTLTLESGQDPGASLGTTIRAGSFGSGDGGEIIINADQIFLSGSFSNLDGILNQANSTGRGGSVTINTTDLFINESALISVASFGAGDAGRIDINASGQVALQAETDFQTGIFNTTFFSGDAGGIAIAAESLEIVGQSSIQAATASFSSGNGGNIELSVRDLLTRDGGVAIAGSFGTGDAGSIVVNATGRVDLDGADSNGFFSLGSATAGPGRGGSVEVSAPELTLRNGARLAVSTSGAGDAGSINLDVSGALLVTGADSEQGIASTIESQSIGALSGNAGSIEISASSLALEEGGLITAGTQSDTGAGGAITATAEQIVLQDQSSIESVSSGAANAGNVTLSGQTLELTGGSSVTTNAEESAGGEIDLQFSDQIYLLESSISAAANGVTPESSGGNVFIDPRFVVLNRSDVLASANAGNGGNIRIRADYIYVDAESTIDASSQTGVDGQVQLESPNTVAETVLQLETPTFDEAELVRNACLRRALQGRSSLVVESVSPGNMALDGYLPNPPLPDSTTLAAIAGGC